MQQHDDNRNDARLVAAVLDGERDAYAPLLMRYYPSVVRLSERLLGATLEAQDNAQEAALQAFLSLSQLHEPERFGAWLHAIAANLARTSLRRRRVLSLDKLPNDSHLVVLWSEGVPTPEDAHVAREVHDAIVAAINELSNINREVVIRFYLEGYSYAELAELLNVPVSAVKGRLFKARRQLRQVLQPVAYEVLRPDRRPQKEDMMRPSHLIEVKISTIYAESWGHRVALLRAEDSDRVLPLQVGPLGADAIAMALLGERFSRPMTHDLMLHLLNPLDARVCHVVINKVAEKIYSAAITVDRTGQLYTVDARPSDALPLAMRAGAPIYVPRELLMREGVEQVHEVGGRFVRWEPKDYSFATLIDLAIAEAPIRQVTWDGQVMIAVQIMGFDEGVRSLGNEPDSNTAWLVVPQQVWEGIVEMAREREQWHRSEGISRH